MHERHGIAKARHGLEALNYVVEKVSLMQGERQPAGCGCWWWPGPNGIAAGEVKAIDDYLAGGGNAFFMLDPFVTTGLEPVAREFGVRSTRHRHRRGQPFLDRRLRAGGDRLQPP